MPSHSIFGASPPPGTQVASDDGTPIWVGNTFYTYGSGSAGWRCYGGRLYVAPGNVASMPSTVTVAVWNNVTRTANNLNATPIESKTVAIPGGGGWVEWTWTTPVTIVAGQPVMIGYTAGQEYLSQPSPTNSFIAASDGSTLVMTDAVNAGPGLDRTYYRYGTSAVVWLTSGDASLWGVDILVDEGTSVVVPSGGSAATVTASAAGAGIRRARGGSAQAVQVSAVGAGIQVLPGVGGSAADVSVVASGAGLRIARGGSAATIGVAAVGAGRNPAGRTIAEENELAGASSDEWEIAGAGDYDNVGFPRSFSTNVGETVEFSCTTDGGGVVLDIYRIGWYGGDGWHKVTSLTNTASAQPAPVTIPNSNGGITCSNWSVTASWDIPADATTGLYVGVYRNAAGNDASYIPFVVRDDNRQADIIIKTSDTTWALAYNYYGGPSAPLAGKSLYGSGGPLGDITTRAQAVSYDRPVVTRQGVTQTYWLACEAPMIRWAERMGYNVKYVASRDLDDDPSRIAGAKILISSGHDEYWTTGMREAVEGFRDAGGHVLFQSGNEVFWRTRFDSTDGNIMWCFKDTQDGPGSHDGGTAIDPVTWTGSWSDTRWVGRKPTNTLNGTYFRMNGVNDKTATFDHTAAYASHPMWRNTDLADGSDFSVAGLIGFEADEYDPPAGINPVRLGQTIVTLTNNRADDNGEFYNLNGNVDWGICSQRTSSGAVVIGFGTCQWSWGLDATHDRGSNVANLNIQQAEYNVLRDLGAAPATPHTGIVTSSAADLSNYGVATIPSGGSVASVGVATTGAGQRRASSGSVAAVDAAVVGAGLTVRSGGSIVTVGATTAGAGYRKAIGAAVATVATSPTGSGLRVAIGSAATTVTVTAIGAGQVKEPGRGGSTSSVTVTVVGGGHGIRSGGSTESVSVSTVGAGHPVATPTGGSVTAVGVSAVGAGSAIHSGGSVALVAVTAVGSGANPEHLRNLTLAATVLDARWTAEVLPARWTATMEAQ